MSTPESPATAPNAKVEHLLGELASRLSSAEASAKEQGDKAVGAAALKPQDLPNIRTALQGAAVRTGAADLLYRSDADSYTTFDAEAAVSAAAAPEIPDGRIPIQSQ